MLCIIEIVKNITNTNIIDSEIFWIKDSKDCGRHGQPNSPVIDENRKSCQVVLSV